MKSLTPYATYSLIALRISLGWLFFYAGITKVINPDWTAGGYLANANTFSEFFAFLVRPDILPFVDFLNEWGLTLLGLSLIFGLFVRLSAPLGALMMLLYYLPVLDFPYPNEHSFIVDEHVVYAAALLVLAAFRSGRIWGLAGMCTSKWPKMCKKVATSLD